MHAETIKGGELRSPISNTSRSSPTVPSMSTPSPLNSLRAPWRSESGGGGGSRGCAHRRHHRSDLHSALYLLLFILVFEVSLRRWDVMIHQIPNALFQNEHLEDDGIARQVHEQLSLTKRDNAQLTSRLPATTGTTTSNDLDSRASSDEEPVPVVQTTASTDITTATAKTEADTTEVTNVVAKAKAEVPVSLQGITSGTHTQDADVPVILPVQRTVSTDLRPTLPVPTVIAWDGYDAMTLLVSTYYGNNNVVCDAISQTRKDTSNEHLAVTINITFTCSDLFRLSGFGTGNFISLFYGLRLMTHVHSGVGLNIACHDADETKSELILPWLTGWFPPRNVNPFPMVSLHESCSSYQMSPISRMYQEIQYDFRRMAIGLVGIPNSKHPSANFFAPDIADKTVDESSRRFHLTVVPSKPAIASATTTTDEDGDSDNAIVLDETVIHFRCGDLMDSDHKHFAFVKFQTYTQHISPMASTIGIITQPFSTPEGMLGQSRWGDRGTVVQDRCRRVVSALVAYIQERHPTSVITIRNGPSETTALAYARMIMANQTIAGISTFGVFPAISTFGTGYLHRPDGPFPNFWMLNPRIDELADNLRLLVDTDYLMVAKLKEMWETQGEEVVLDWFRGDIISTKVAQIQQR